ncbi:glycosyltransferase family 4 protein [Flavobacterium psychrotrophum]|uniref:glycosyltransferase family 4 protein n=1 Tax=Flavobacterium psychrotrophum TaxID=2294119 RepID=UPI000E31B773|nr:glycosyltransferase family 1 protein [Flavobacterium psychrotrophum]
MSQYKQLSIFIDCHVFDGTFQGTTTYLKGIYTEMVKNKGINFYFAALDIIHLEKIFGTAPNINYLQYKNHNKFYRLLFDIPAMIKQHKIDYAHFQYVVPPIKHCKYIVTLHDVIFMEHPEFVPAGYRIKNNILFKWSAKKADILLTISEYSKAQIKKHFGLVADAITINTAEDIFFEPYDKPAVQKQVAARFDFSNYLIFVSRWEPRKNHHGLLKAFAQGEFYKNYHLVFVGDDAIKNAEYEALYASLPPQVTQKVVCLRKVGFADLLLLVRGASLSVYPSFAEGFGISPLEAVAAGIPVACSGATAMADFTFLSNTLFDPHSTNDMIAKINIALTTDNSGVAGALKQKYSWANAAGVLQSLLKPSVQKN